MGAALAASGTEGVRVKMCNEYCRQYHDEGDTFLNRVVTCDDFGWLVVLGLATL